MLENLQKKWKVNGWRLLFILMTFAIGGSLTGFVGKKFMTLMGIENAWLYIPVYIIIITLVWPLMVIIVSIPLGQFAFFRQYLRRLSSRMKLGGKRSKIN